MVKRRFGLAGKLEDLSGVGPSGPRNESPQWAMNRSTAMSEPKASEEDAL